MDWHAHIGWTDAKSPKRKCRFERGKLGMLTPLSFLMISWVSTKGKKKGRPDKAKKSSSGPRRGKASTRTGPSIGKINPRPRARLDERLESGLSQNR
ncbi:MAG: hypothetical protein CM1200mP15_00810 [Dehalococcoidia bacterium]|nr:MAG: hypothetical protein CM1200mP15_00810 [Dehalococcoidia bacterium]